MQNVFGKTLTGYLETLTGSKRRRTDTSCHTDPAPPTTPPPFVRENAFQMQTESYDGSQSNLSASTASPLSAPTSDDDDGVQTVYESKVALIPACSNSHGKVKGKDKLDPPRRCSLKILGCGKHPECGQGRITPSTAIEPLFRLTTGNAQHDLKRWLTTPNSRLCGGEAERTIAFVQDDRFTDTDLEILMAFVICEIQYEHAYVKGLIDYAQRFPYMLHLRGAQQADRDYIQMKPEHFYDVPRIGLEEDVVHAAIELDYLRSVAEYAGRNILIAKQKAATDGDWWEIAELERFGVIGRAKDESMLIA